MRRWLWLVVAVLAGLGAVALVRSLGLGVPARVLPAAGSEPRRCAAETRSGERCTREADAGSRFCWQHG